jgi:REP element-mobilizing transposase RayT
LPFGPAEKECFIGLMRKLLRLYTIEIVAYQFMGNHFHLLAFIPGQGLPEAAAVARFNAYYDGKKVVQPATERAAALPEQLRDVSRFMKDLQQQFTRWFNRTRPVRRRGHLWQERFKNTIMEEGLSVWHCWRYLELNPVRARMVADPADYRFCTLAQWSATGRHPWEQTVRQRVLPRLPEGLGAADMDGLLAALRRAVAVTAATEAGQPQAVVEIVAQRAAEKQPFTTRADRRVRYWVDGLVIGSVIFVKTVLARARGEAAVAQRRLTRARAPDPLCPRPDLYCCRQLREIV